MASTKVFLDRRRAKANGTFPLKIRVTHQQDSFVYSLSIYINETQWDEPHQQVLAFSPNAKSLNQNIQIDHYHSPA